MAYSKSVGPGGAAGFEQVTVDNTAGGVSLTAANYSSGYEIAASAVVIVETAQIRWTVDGTAPTTSVGMLGDIGDVITLTSPTDITAFKAIRTGASSATIDVTYFRPAVI